MSAESQLLTELVRRIYDEVLDQTGSEGMALLAASTVQRDGLEDLGAPPGVIANLTANLVKLREQVEAENPELFEPPKPSWSLPSIPTPSIPGLGAIQDWLRDRIRDLGDIVGAIAGAVLDAAVAVVEATLPTITEIALSLVGAIEGTLSFIGDNLAQLDDVAAALGRGVGSGLEDAAGELGNRIASAVGNLLSGALEPLVSSAADVPTIEAFELELGPRA